MNKAAPPLKMPNSFIHKPKSLAFRKGMVIASLNINSLLLHKEELASVSSEKESILWHSMKLSLTRRCQ